MISRSSRLASAVLGVVLTASACGGSDEPEAQPTRTPSPATSTTAPTPPPEPPPAPEVGACYDLSAEDLTAGSSEIAPVRCGRPHTSVTIATGTFDPIADGHYLAVDSEHVQSQVREACPTTLTDWVGDGVDPRLSRLRVLWFTPSLEQAEAGARWYRCDVVALASEGQPARVTGDLRGVLDDESGLDRVGRCSVGDPASANATRVMCDRRHTWQAVEVVELPADVAYADRAARRRGDAQCRATAEARAADPLEFSWRFEWPSRADYDAGQRHALCWLPAS